MKRPLAIPPAYLLLAIIVMLVLHWQWPVMELVPRSGRWVGLAIIAASILFSTSAIVLLRRHKTTVRPGAESTFLVTGGPFRISRNPVYLGMAFTLVGLAIALGSLTPWLVIPFFIIIIATLVIPMEERMLHERFGTAFDTYRQRVRCWI